MTQEHKDICKTCDNYWQDFVVSPVKQFISHCSVADKNMDLEKWKMLFIILV